MFIKRKPIQTQTVSDIVSKVMPDMETTQKMLKEQIKDLQQFTTTEIPKAKQTQEELIASLEKLAQAAKYLTK